MMNKLLPLALALLFLAPISASAWDQDAVSTLVDDIVVSLEELLTEARDMPPQSEVLMQRNFDAALSQLEKLVRETGVLASRLSAGEDRHQTTLRYLKLADLRQSVRLYAESAEVDEAIIATADRVIAQMKELDAAYAE